MYSHSAADGRMPECSVIRAFAPRSSANTSSHAGLSVVALRCAAQLFKESGYNPGTGCAAPPGPLTLDVRSYCTSPATEVHP